MSKKLYRVRVEAELHICVLAESTAEAQRLAGHSISDELDARGHDVWHVRDAHPVTEAKQVESEWLDAIPYGAKEDFTVGEILRGRTET